MTTDYEDAVAIGDLSVRLLRPSAPEELFAVAAEARGDAPYWAELWPCARALAAHLATLDLTGVRVLELAGPTGLLSEQYDPRAERALGNHPQAYSHLGLIRTALVLDRLPR